MLVLFHMAENVETGMSQAFSFINYFKQGRPGGVVEYQYTRKKIDKIPQNTPNSSKYTQK